MSADSTDTDSTARYAAQFEGRFDDEHDMLLHDFARKPSRSRLRRYAPWATVLLVIAAFSTAYEIWFRTPQP